MTVNKPVMYLDIDDTLICWYKNPKPAFKAKQFLLWATTHFEVRWLTWWCPSGTLDDADARKLGYFFELPSSVFSDIRNPLSFVKNKTDAIDWKEHYSGRKWVWIEDAVWQYDRDILRLHKAGLNHIPCHVTANYHRLSKVWEMVAERFNLPMPVLDLDKALAS